MLLIRAATGITIWLFIVNAIQVWSPTKIHNNCSWASLHGIDKEKAIPFTSSLPSPLLFLSSFYLSIHYVIVFQCYPVSRPFTLPSVYYVIMSFNTFCLLSFVWFANILFSFASQTNERINGNSRRQDDYLQWWYQSSHRTRKQILNITSFAADSIIIRPWCSRWWRLSVILWNTGEVLSAIQAGSGASKT